MNAAILRKRENPKSFEPSRCQCGTELRLVHAEAAGTSAGCGEINILLHDVSGTESRLLKAVQVPEQIAYSEINRIAQAARAILLRHLVGGAIGFRQPLASVSGTGEQTFDQTLVLPRKTAEEDGYRAAFFRSKGKFLRSQWHKCMALAIVSDIA